VNSPVVGEMLSFRSQIVNGFEIAFQHLLFRFLVTHERFEAREFVTLGHIRVLLSFETSIAFDTSLALSFTKQRFSLVETGGLSTTII